MALTAEAEETAKRCGLLSDIDGGKPSALKVMEVSLLKSAIMALLLFVPAT